MKYYSLTGHLMNIGFEMIHERSINKIPADLRDMVLAAGKEAAAVGRKYDVDVDVKFMKKLTDAGIIVNEVDTAPFVGRARAVHDQMARELKGEKFLEIARAEAKRCH